MIILKGNPISTQHIYKYACRGNYPCMYMTREGRAIKESYQWQAKVQWGKKPIKEDVGLVVRLFFNNERNRDIDNYNKILLDALSGIVFEDDKQIQQITISKAIDRDEPRIEVDIIKLKNL